MRSGVIDLVLDHPTPGTTVVNASGALDAGTVGTLERLLSSRPADTADLVMLDVSRAQFVGIAALELMLRTHHSMRERGTTFCVVSDSYLVERAMRVAGLTEQIPCYSSVSVALAEHDRLTTSRS
jgi:anti-anti-sigma factor